jgi:sporulation protein YlmC with PRC-barrel domain
MKKSQSIKVFSELRDLEVFDRGSHLCGIADDIEFDGEPLRATAILVGPGAYRRRLPQPLRVLARLIAGDTFVRVPWESVEHVTSRITLNKTSADLGLRRADEKLRPLIEKVPFA